MKCGLDMLYSNDKQKSTLADQACGVDLRYILSLAVFILALPLLLCKACLVIQHFAEDDNNE